MRQQTKKKKRLAILKIFNVKYSSIKVFTRLFFKITQQGIRKKLIRWAISDDQPFVVVEKPEFKDIILYLWPEAKIPSADMLRKDLSSNYKQVKEEVCHKLVSYLNRLIITDL